MPEQPPDPHHYEMKVPPEPEYATLKKHESEKSPADDQKRDAAHAAKDTESVHDDDQAQSIRREE